MTLKKCRIGIIGLGQMGSGIASNIARSGYSIVGYDLKPEAIAKLSDAGVGCAESPEQIITTCDIVLTCVEGRDSIKLADTFLVSHARSDQIFIDHSTVSPPQTRRIGQGFDEKGARYLDAPISGGKQGAAAGTLRVFVGGDKETAEQCWPLFEAIGNPKKIVYCGVTGMGQVAKIVQQLTTRFLDVARMELMSFGLRAGLDLDTLMRALDVSPESNDPYAKLYAAIKSNNADGVSTAFAEWPYYLEEVKAQGFRMPMLKAMYEFCKDGKKTEVDPLGRLMPSIWNELMNFSCEPD